MLCRRKLDISIIFPLVSLFFKHKIFAESNESSGHSNSVFFVLKICITSLIHSRVVERED